MILPDDCDFRGRETVLSADMAKGVTGNLGIDIQMNNAKKQQAVSNCYIGLVFSNKAQAIVLMIKLRFTYDLIASYKVCKGKPDKSGFPFG